ncbi:Nucleic acid-binding OB-fold [Penicillium cf. griseofulvum]|nr:Nucleic acid-binding OB-fold [Penicillium cf. griseofulvum]
MLPREILEILNCRTPRARNHLGDTSPHTLRTASTSTPTPTKPKTTGTETQAPSRLRNYASALKTGTVVSVGRMDRTVGVCHRHTLWDRHIRKFYPQETHYLVSDPRNSLREGDVIEFSSGAPKSRNVHHVVERIITPFGQAIEDRPAVLSKAEREAERETRWAAKYLRRESKRLGREVDLVQEAAKAGVPVPKDEVLSTAQLIHRIHGGNERVGKVKRIVQERVAESERITQERAKEAAQ